MEDCCGAKTNELVALRASQGRVLKLVLAINSVMFFIEATAGVMARSTALLADSLDMFGDAAVYAFSLYVIDRGPVWKSRAALAKGILMAAFGVGVLAQAVAKMLTGVSPQAETMGVVGAVALAANVACLSLLYRHRSDDLNMRSTWLCSRNDIIANCGVLVAAGAVAWLGSGWPDVVVGLAIAALFLKDAAAVLRDATGELRAASRAQA
jgi:cation diffusion facilitator family transporter